MKTVLVLGGYGTFGSRIARGAAEAGFEVLVAGRSGAKAAAFCAGRDRLLPVALDRGEGLAEALRRHRPFALVDAAGPFQGSGYAVARAALSAGCHYIDIADGRAFVTGIGALDGDARAAGLCAVAGASSLPALSGAVVGRLAEGLERVHAAEIVLSASSRGTAGRSVTAAVLSYLGKPVRLRRGGRWSEARGWQELRRRDFEIAGEPPLRRRLVALADVPDLDLLPARLPGRPAVSFLAGTDVPLHNIGLWLLSWPVRWNWLGEVTGLAGLLSRIQHWTRFAGSKRSAMEVAVYGTVGARRIERRWTLIAGEGQGPEIPSLAVPLLLDRLARGALPPGATDAGTLLSLDEFQPALGRLATAQGVVEREHPPPLYARVMGAPFAALPPAVRAMHEVFADSGASGRAVVTRGRNPLARLAAFLFRFPPAGEHALRLSIAERGGIERWTREFSGHRFASRLREEGGCLVERFGPLHFSFDLLLEPGGLAMKMRGWRLWRMPLPLALAPRSPAREWQEEGRFQFDVPIALPLVGLVVRYRGWLEPEA